MSSPSGIGGATPEAAPSKARVTSGDIDFALATARGVQYHVFTGTTMTVVCVTLANGFKVMGYSAPVSDANFDEAVGEQVALDKVRDQLWELLGFRLKQAMFEGRAGVIRGEGGGS